MDIILASSSPRRRELVEQIGIKEYQILSPDVDESIDGDILPGEQVEILSRRKARAVWERVGGASLIIAADTVVALEGQVLGKPKDEADAFKMLSLLSGQSHQVYTGFTLRRGDQEVVDHEVTTVTFRALSDEEIHYYIATGEPMDKAGAYGIQGVGALLISGIVGDYFNVMGLPVFKLGLALKEFGVDALALAAGE